jgi:xanthine dehydrogenase accessory factor
MRGPKLLCAIRGGGDLATGVAWRLTRAGVGVIGTELAAPLTVRRTVALSSAVTEGIVDIEGMIGRRVATAEDAAALAYTGEVAVLVSPALPQVDAGVVVDARLAKRNIDTSIDDAPLVIGLGPGFSAGEDCHVVVETMRGPRLGRALWTGSAEPDTGTPGIVDGHGAERVLRAPTEGVVRWFTAIGDVVEQGALLGTIADQQVLAPFPGVVRGLILDGSEVPAGLKIGDLDPRVNLTGVDEISDKALAIGGGVVEAVMWWRNKTS